MDRKSRHEPSPAERAKGKKHPAEPGVGPPDTGRLEHAAPPRSGEPDLDKKTDDEPERH